MMITSLASLALGSLVASRLALGTDLSYCSLIPKHLSLRPPPYLKTHTRPAIAASLELLLKLNKYCIMSGLYL